MKREHVAVHLKKDSERNNILYLYKCFNILINDKSQDLRSFSFCSSMTFHFAPALDTHSSGFYTWPWRVLKR